MYKESILLVDDDRTAAVAVKNALTNSGFTVIKSDSCSEALSIIQRKNIDVLIFSLAIQEDNALEILHRARFLSPEIGVIVMTQNDSPDILIKAFQAGAQAILEKPVDEKNLKKVVEEVLQHSRLAKENLLP